MTFQEYVARHTENERTNVLIKRFGITEYTPYSRMIQCGGIGKLSAPIIEQLQQDYIKTFDVAYQQVIESIRNHCSHS